MSARGIINKLVIFLVAKTLFFKCISLSKEAKLLFGCSQTISLNFTEVTVKNLYSSEEHTVITEDGYVLTLFRIIEATHCRHKRKHRPILLMHGFLQNSDIFIDAGPTAGLAYLLSDACYDVWVGNQRGNNHARKHVRLNPDRDEEFWRFSADEIGFYDIPATVDYILNHTDADKLNYIGYSQGGGAYFMMCSERPGHCKKTAVMIALAPAVILDHEESTILRFTFKFAAFFKDIFELFGVREVFKKGEFPQSLFQYLCQMIDSAWTERLCATAGYIDNYHAGSLSSSTRRRIYNNLFIGTSMNTVVRYGQVLLSGKFQKFDFGKTINMERYNNTRAPEYNLNAVSTPVVLIQGKNDKLVNIEDTRMLSTMLPNLLEMVVIQDPDWNHLDMVYSRHIKKLIYPKVHEYLEMYSESVVSADRSIHTSEKVRKVKISVETISGSLLTL